jgi:hypothetical protein
MLEKNSPNILNTERELKGKIPQKNKANIMNESYFTGIPWQRFMEFIAMDASRFSILKELLENAGLDYKVVDMAGSRHFIVSPPPPEEKYLRRPPTVLVAHYDRAEGSPGANDNSAGVFILIEMAAKLRKKNVNNWLVIFTDNEELKSGERIQAQGSYSLAEGLKNSRIENSRIFCFDTCGTGDTLIISNTLEFLLKKEGVGEKTKLMESLTESRKLALDTARNLSMKKVLLAPTPFSDDVGFFRAGLAAQTITMLPTDECIRLVSELRKNPEFADVLISAELRKTIRSHSIPDTWRSLNSSADSHLRLTPENFRTVLRFAEELCSG